MKFQLLPIAALAVSSAMPAVAQDVPPGGDIPVYDITPRPVPMAPPSPIVAPTPAPRPTPTPRVTTTPRPRPAPVVTATPTPVQTPRVRQNDAVQIARPTPVAAPEVEPTPVPLPTPSTSATPAAEPAPVPAASPSMAAPVSDTPWWLWFLAGAAVAGIVAFLMGRRRGRQEVVASPAPDPIVPPQPAAPPSPPVPVPAAPKVVPVAPPVPVTPPSTPGPVLEFQLAPLRVGLQGDNAVLDFDLGVGNPTGQAVDEVRVATLMLTANPRQDQQIAAFLAGEGAAALDPFAVGAGERRELEATMTLPRAALNIVTANDRPFFVPVMVIDARYRWADGRESRTSAAFMIGPPLSTGRLSPIFTDRGDRMADRLEARLYGEVRRS